MLTWCFAFLIILPQAFSTNGFFLEGFQVSCTFDYFSRDFKSRMLLFYMVIFGFVTPIFVIAFVYIKIYSLVKNENIQKTETFELSKSVRKYSHVSTSDLEAMFEEKSQRKSSISQLTTHFLTHKCSRLFKRRNALKSPADLINLKPKYFLLEREVRVAKMVLIRVLLFCLAWTPYVIVILLTQFGSNIEEYITPITTSLPSLFAKSSTIFNALVYTLNQKECRTFYLDMFQKSRNQINSNI